MRLSSVLIYTPIALVFGETEMVTARDGKLMPKFLETYTRMDCIRDCEAFHASSKRRTLPGQCPESCKIKMSDRNRVNALDFDIGHFYPFNGPYTDITAQEVRYRGTKPQVPTQRESSKSDVLPEPKCENCNDDNRFEVSKIKATLVDPKINKTVSIVLDNMFEDPKHANSKANENVYSQESVKKPNKETSIRGLLN